MNEGGKNRSSSPAQEMRVEKKPKTSSATREGSFAIDRLVIDLISSKGNKYETARFEPVTPAMPKVAGKITDKITHSHCC